MADWGALTDLQKTPDSSPKVMLKIFEKNPAGGAPVTYLFHFNTPDAKAEAEIIRDVLSRIIGSLQSDNPDLPKAAQPTPNGPTPTPDAPGSG
ncbi:hypothetical protein IMZ48_22315, partial [Candidatus Bathyarchaeota archaeon]|nr:hypothetical protein [Candidatus Bathyarchaeota archaeon]